MEIKTGCWRLFRFHIVSMTEGFGDFYFYAANDTIIAIHKIILFSFGHLSFIRNSTQKQTGETNNRSKRIIWNYLLVLLNVSYASTYIIRNDD